MTDAVVTWVDSSDVKWREKKREWENKLGIAGSSVSDGSDSRDERYRDFGIFKYWFRAVEKNLPWLRRIYLVTDRQIPGFLNTDNEKLRVVYHDEIIPEEYLPTFNSCAIELFFHRIPGLSENFIYFNDDFFVNRPVKETDFFRDGKPLDMLAFQPVVANPLNPVMTHLLQNEALVLSKYFDKRTVVKTNKRGAYKIGYPLKYYVYNHLEMAFPKFTGFYNVHMHMNLMKSTYEKLWELEKESFCETASHRFRSREDIPIYVFKDYEKLSGNFVPVNMEKGFRYYETSGDILKLTGDIRNRKSRFLCINDSNSGIDFEGVKKALDEAFLSVYPEKSSFEI